MKRLKFVEVIKNPSEKIKKILAESIFNEEEALAITLPIVIVEQFDRKWSWFVCRASDSAVLASGDIDSFYNAEDYAVSVRKMIVNNIIANANIPNGLQKSTMVLTGINLER